MASHPPRSGVSEEEFLSLPESLERIELLDGEVILPPSPTYEHQRIVAELCRRLMGWAESHAPAAVGLAPLDVRLAPGRIVQPDLFVVRSGLSTDARGPVNQVPEFVVEVTSANRSYDRMTKRLAYAEAGVSEYWVIDRQERRVEQIMGLETSRIWTHGATALAEVLDGFEVPVACLFPVSDGV